jgi:hypothetical protein
MEQNDGNPVVAAEENTGTAPELEVIAPDTGDQPADDETEPEHDQQPRWARKNIARLSRQKKQLQDRLDTESAARTAAEEKAATLEAKLAAPAAGNMPTQGDFETAEEWASAMIDWKLKAKESVQAVEQESKSKAAKAKESDDRFFAKRDELFESLENDYGTELIQKIVSMPVMPRSFAEEILETDNPQEVLKFLAENIEDANKIAALPEKKRAIALGRIEARLTAPRKIEKSKAPPPINPVSGTSGMKTENIPEDTSSLARWLGQ